MLFLREKVSPFSTATADANVVMAFRKNQPGCVGIAWTGTVCEKDPQWRTALCEYFQNDLTAGEVLFY